MQPSGDVQAPVSDYFRAIEQQATIQSTTADSLLQLQLAVAAFLVFTQANLTG